jgi:hypothetical protein
MAITVQMGVEQVIESVKADPGGAATPENLRIVMRPELGRQILTCSIPETHVIETVVLKSQLNDTAHQMPGHLFVPRGRSGTPVKAHNAHELEAVHHIAGASVVASLDDDDEVLLRQTMWPVEEQLRALRDFVALSVADGKPSWVEASSAAPEHEGQAKMLQAAISVQYGCPEKRPSNWSRG